MRVILIRWLVVVALVAGAIGWVTAVLLHRADAQPPVLPLSSMLTMGIIAVVTLVLGIKVLRWTRTAKDRRRRRMLNPILATRTLVLAQACAYAGSVLVGWHIGVGADLFPLLYVRSNNGDLWLSLAMIGGGLVMVAIGLVVERFCRIPPEDDDDDGSSGNGTAATGDEGEYA